MKVALFIFGTLWAIGLVCMYYVIKKSPEGYEKDGKFHYGKEPTE